MKSIEERAIKIEDKIISLDPQPVYWKAIRMAAIQGANEQKAIDDAEREEIIRNLEGAKLLINNLQAEINLNTMITFTCINKDVSMSVQQLIDYYVDTECVKVAEECNF